MNILSLLKVKILLGSLIAAALIGGSAFIVYAGRPVMKLQDDDADGQVPESESDSDDALDVNPVPAPAPTPTPAPAPAPTPTPTPGTYTMADVRAHASSASCWSAISGNVYDLTDWIDRHPGGRGLIIEICGIDGTAAYNGQHGNRSRPASLLALFKIGSLR